MISAAYLRPHDYGRVVTAQGIRRDSDEWIHATEFASALLTWAELTNAKVVNRPSNMSSNNSKPFQARQIRAFGFATPETLITNDPCALDDFSQQHGAVIYKSISGVRSIVSSLGSSERARINDVTSCPVQFQRLVIGRDYRVHVVAGHIFACRIESNATDYRYPGGHAGELTVQQIALPKDISERCRKMATGMGLLLAGIDLRCSTTNTSHPPFDANEAGGDWYCFEVNPSPAFTCYEDSTCQPITKAVARLLCS